MSIVRRTFSFDSETDKDILDFLDSSQVEGQEKSKTVRIALRDFMGKPPEPTSSDIMAMVKNIATMLKSGQLVMYQNESTDDGPEPEEARRNLDDFLDLVDDL